MSPDPEAQRDVERLDDWEDRLDERRDQEGDAAVDERLRELAETEADPEDRPVGPTERITLPEDERPVYYDDDEA